MTFGVVRIEVVVHVCDSATLLKRLCLECSLTAGKKSRNARSRRGSLGKSSPHVTDFHQEQEILKCKGCSSNNLTILNASSFQGRIIVAVQTFSSSACTRLSDSAPTKPDHTLLLHLTPASHCAIFTERATSRGSSFPLSFDLLSR